VTLNEEQENTKCPDYDYMLTLYDTCTNRPTNDGDRNTMDLVFHRVREEPGGRTDRQLIEYVLETILGLPYGQNIEKVERFGSFYCPIRPIRVRMSTAEECREILRRAKNYLTLQKEFGRIYIQPYLSRQQLQSIRQELEDNLYELNRNGYPRAKIEFWRIVQYSWNGEPEILYTPQM